MFSALKIFLERLPQKFRRGIIKLNILRSIVQNFAAIGPRSSEITRGEKNLKFGAKPNVSPPGVLSPIGGEILRGKIPPVAKSRGPHTNALAYAKHALLT